MYCLEDRLCVWRPPSITELSYNLVMIEGHPVWAAQEGTYQIEQLQITTLR